MVRKTIVSKLNTNQYKEIEKFVITYGTASTEFGNCLLGLHDNNICFLSFFDGVNPSLTDLKKAFPNAELNRDDKLVEKYAKKLFEEKGGNEDINLLLKGTDFEMNVWEELINLKKGSTASYSDVASALGNPKAIRAVARAVAKNNVSYLIPCHRVISKTGGLSKYRWGAERKLKMLKFEGVKI